MLNCHLYCISKCYFSSSEAYPPEVFCGKGVLTNLAKFTEKRVPKSILKKSLPKSLLIKIEKETITQVFSL